MALQTRFMRPLARFQSQATFSPLALSGLQLWLDATDSQSITLNSGNVSQWADKSPQGNNATQATAIRQPAYATASVNGLSSVEFDGTNDFMDITVSGIGGLATGFFAWVIEPIAAGNTDGYDPSIAFVSSDSTDLGALHYIKQNLTGASYPWYLPGVNPYDGFGSYSYGQQVMLSFERNNSAANVFKNGDLEGAISSLPASTTAVGLRLAMQPDPARHSNIRVCEVIACFGSVAGDRAKAEGYLAHRWGLAASLPSGHPYKDAAP
jgi:hypothetical protein